MTLSIQCFYGHNGPTIMKTTDMTTGKELIKKA